MPAIIYACLKAEQDIVFAEHREHICGKFGECNTYCRDGAGLYNGKKAPAIQECDQGVIGFFEVYVLPAGFGKHTAEFAIAERCSECHKTGDEPDQYQPTGAANITGDVCADNKNSGTDHASRNNHCGIEQAKCWFKCRGAVGHKAVCMVDEKNGNKKPRSTLRGLKI